MLKKLRIKLVCINMVLLTAMLCAILGLVVHFTRAGLEAESLQMMQAAARPSPPGRRDRRPEDFRLPCVVLRLNRDGQSFTGEGEAYGLSRADLEELLRRAADAGSPTGVLAEYGLRYLWVAGPEPCLVLTDISQERAALAQLTRTCVLAGLCGFGVLLFVSFFLARWAVRPVERAWDQQRQFVADASHELKTPLTVILTNAELLQGQSAGPPAEHILTMARQMRGLAENLLELARADNAPPEPHTPLDLSRLISDAALPFEALFFERGLILSEEVEAGITVKGSASQLRQAADVFLDNAQKYAAPGQVTLGLRRKGRNRCVLWLSSPGEPIPREELDQIFKRFYRLDRARSRDGSYGLGLSIVQSIAAAHRGRAWAESGAEGNTFFLELPTVSG